MTEPQQHAGLDSFVSVSGLSALALGLCAGLAAGASELFFDRGDDGFDSVLLRVLFVALLAGSAFLCALLCVGGGFLRLLLGGWRMPLKTAAPFGICCAALIAAYTLN